MIKVVATNTISVISGVDCDVDSGGSGGGGMTPGLLISPANTGTDRIANNARESTCLMETSVTAKNGNSIAEVVAEATIPVGEQYKDYWAKLAREGDLWACNKLARCYESTGELREGLIIANDLLRRQDLPKALRTEALLTKAVLQQDSPALAWKTINDADLETEPNLRGRLHNQRGRILSDLKRLDPAIIEFTAATYYFELAEADELRAFAYNNLASMYRKTRRFQEAHDSVDRAISLCGDSDYLPHMFDLKAAIYIDQGRYIDARTYALNALRGTTDRHRWQAEFLCTLAIAEAGLNRNSNAMCAITDALQISDYLNDENLKLNILRTSKKVCGMMYDKADEAAVRLALSLTDGKVRQAAKKLGIAHSSLLKSIRKYPEAKTAK